MTLLFFLLNKYFSGGRFEFTQPRHVDPEKGGINLIGMHSDSLRAIISEGKKEQHFLSLVAVVVVVVVVRQQSKNFHFFRGIFIWEGGPF